MIGPAVHNHASHEIRLPRLKRVFDHVQRPVKQRVDPFAVGLEQLRDKEARSWPVAAW